MVLARRTEREVVDRVEEQGAGGSLAYPVFEERGRNVSMRIQRG